MIEAVAQREPKRMASLASRALATPALQNLALHFTRAALLGYLASGETRRAYQVVERWMPTPVPEGADLTARLLRELTLSRAAR
jgi:hypothetical protein